MKKSTHKLFILLIAFSIFASAIPVHANIVYKTGTKVVIKTADDALKYAAKLSGKKFGPAAYRAAVEQLQAAAVRHGNNVFRAASSGGVELMQVAAKYGDDVWKYTRVVPEGSRALALNPETYLPLCRKYGADILRLESKLASSAPKVAKHFGKNGVELLAKNQVPASHISQLTGLAKRAASQETKTLLLKSYLKKGAEIFNHLNAKNILATGLTTAMVISAYQLSDGMQTAFIETGEGAHEGMVNVSQASPEIFGDTISKMFWAAMSPFAIPLYGLTLLFLLNYTRKKFFQRTRKQQKKRHEDDS